MKKLFTIIAAISLLSCTQKSPNDFVTLHGKISNSEARTLTVLGKNFQKEISVNEDGTFKDTLKVVSGFHGFNDGNLQSFLYLKNGYDLELNFDVQDFPASIHFDGEGAVTNNYLGKKLKFIKDDGLDNYASIFELDKTEFDARIETIKTQMDKMIKEANGLDPIVIEMEKDANNKLIEFYASNYDKEHNNYSSLKKGEPSPKFNYPDINGKEVSLDDLKGKYVYVDVWATWCGPCKREIPYLKELDHEFKNKDLAIVSLSIDKMEHKEKWLKMIQDENLQGIQIMADKDWNSDFVTAYNITGIPRFILIDKEGNILNANAPRPSDPNLKELLNSLSL